MTIEMKLKLDDLGWNEVLKESYENYNQQYKVGRVAIEHRNMYKIYTETGEILGIVSGKMKHNALGREDYPAVGDWVLIDRTNPKEGNAVIHGMLPRKSKFSRKVAGDETEEQIIAVNIDTVFICMSLNHDFNLRRLERYLIAAWESGSNPVILLTKADLSEEVEEKKQEVESVAFGVNTHVVSAVDGTGVEELSQYIEKGKTVAFLGSSGIGKSTLINYLLGEERLATKEVREADDRGRHTTTHRELVVLPEGGVVIDTPGMREFHIMDNAEGIDSTFSDIESLAIHCKFNDCKHDSEPGCAVKEAIQQGNLSEKRFSNYLKLLKEAAYMERKAAAQQRKAEKNKTRK